MMTDGERAVEALRAACDDVVPPQPYVVHPQFKKDMEAMYRSAFMDTGGNGMKVIADFLYEAEVETEDEAKRLVREKADTFGMRLRCVMLTEGDVVEDKDGSLGVHVKLEG